MAARFAIVKGEEIRQINEEATPANTKSNCLVKKTDKKQNQLPPQCQCLVI